MKGYKYLLEGMEAPFQQDFVYELDKWYEVEDDSKLEICKYGFHFFKDIRDLLSYIFTEDSTIHIYEIEADGKVIGGGDSIRSLKVHDKYCSSKIRITKELSKEEIWKLIEDRNILYCDNWKARATVAKQGYGLETLINDTHWLVRVAVARHGYGLDKLINDEDEDVCVEVANQGYGLDTLVNDPHFKVRGAVAEQGYGLDVLINDEDEDVREIVAEQEYSLDHA